MELSAPKIKNFLIFSQKSFAYILGNGTSYISGGNFPKSKNKKSFLYLRKWNFLASYFGRGNFPASTLKFVIFFPEKIHSKKISYIFSMKILLTFWGNEIF